MGQRPATEIRLEILALSCQIRRRFFDGQCQRDADIDLYHADIIGDY